MATIVTRAGKGSALTFTEGDANFTNLNTAKLENVVEDVSPQLGASLDVNGFAITSVNDGDITIAPDDLGKTFVRRIRYNEVIHDLGTTSGTITPNVGNGNVQTITLNGNLTFNAFASPIAGQSLTLIVRTNATGRTLTSTMKFAGRNKTFSNDNTIDIISVFYDGTDYLASIVKDYGAS
jgi:hypothetical protein